MSEAEVKTIERGTTSPKYSLEESIALAVTLNQAFGARTMGKDAIAEALGHSVNSSAVAVKIGSLSHYDLLVRQGNTYAQSALVKDILYPTSDDAKRVAIVKAAKAPSLYKRLFTDFAGKALPSMLENILHRDYGVARANAGDVAKTFRKTAEFAGLYDAGVLYADPRPGSTSADAVESPKASEPRSPEEGVAASSQPFAPGPMSDERDNTFSVPISGKRVARLQLPRPIRSADLARIQKWLELMEEVLTEEDSDPITPE